MSTQHYWIPGLLIALNVTGAVISNLILILLARNLAHAQFETYVGTIATLGLVASLGEAGLGKYAMQAYPRWIAERTSAAAIRYLGFATAMLLLNSLVLGVAIGAAEIWVQPRAAERALLVGLAFLPAMVGAGVFLDLLAAVGHSGASTAIARILMPLTTLAGIAVVMGHSVPSSALCVACFGMGSTLGFGCAAVLSGHALRQRVGHQPWLAALRPRRWPWRKWLTGSASFLGLSFLIAGLIRAPLVVLHHVNHAPDELGLLAPAFETGAFVLLLAKSTDKFYLPQMALLLARRAWDEEPRFRWKRARLVGGGVLLFLLAVAVAGRGYLRLYGPGFEAGYPALLWVSLAFGGLTLFSLAPALLIFADQRGKLLANGCIHAAVVLVATVLSARSGPTAIARWFAVAILSFCLVNVVLANRRLAALKTSPAPSGGSDACGARK